MGAIFEAEHLATERRVALKLLFPHIMSIASARQKFELEAKVSARVNSRFIVEVLDAGFDEASKSPFLVMELLDGQTLAARIREHGPLGIDEALRLLEQVAAGLDAAHGYREASGAPKPIVHRDLKPENLFLARQHDGSVLAKILDYGIAKVLGDTTHISQEVRGTPLFMAFEQVTAGALSPQTDVWALGLIAYHMLTGSCYWRSAERPGSSVQALFAEILTLPLAPPSVRLRDQNIGVVLPAAFDPWLLRCIDREPRQRFPSAGAAIEALGRVFEQAPRVTPRQAAPLARASEKTQTFIAADAARAAAPAMPAAPTSHGSLPALSASRHRWSLPSGVMTSPLHWAAVGAASGVLLLGGVAWLALRDEPSSRQTAAASHEPATRLEPAVAAPQPATPQAAPAQRQATPELPEGPESSGSSSSSPAPNRLESNDPASNGPGSNDAASNGPVANGDGAPPAALPPRVRIAPLVEAPPAASDAASSSVAAPQAAASADSRVRSTDAPAAAAPSASGPGAAAREQAPSPPAAKRPRQRVGSTEAYKTR